MDICQKIATELQIKPKQVEATVKLIDEGNTIPFIARYRKEVTGALNDEVLRNLFDRITYLRNLEEKTESVLKSIEEQGLLTEELKKDIENAETMVGVGKGIELRRVQFVVGRHIERLVTAARHKRLEERLPRLFDVSEHTVVHRSVSHSPLSRAQFRAELILRRDILEARTHDVGLHVAEVRVATIVEMRGVAIAHQRACYGRQ